MNQKKTIKYLTPSDSDSMKELMRGNETVSSILMGFHLDDFLRERISDEKNANRVSESESPFQRDPKEISNIVIRERVLQMLYSASLRKRLLGNNQLESATSPASEDERVRNRSLEEETHSKQKQQQKPLSPATKLCLSIFRQYLRKEKIPLDELDSLISEIEPLSMFTKSDRKPVEVRVPLNPIGVSPRSIRCLIGT